MSKRTKSVTKNLIARKLPKAGNLPARDPLRPTLDGSQPAAFEALKKPRNVILNAPTGWGKSLVIMMISVWKLLRDSKLRCIIVVPQMVIARSFKGPKFLTVSGRVIEWLIGATDLCDGKDTTNRFVKFLKSKHGIFSDRLLICSHSTLTGVYRNLKDSGKLSLFRNTVIWIDEAHHVMNAEVEGKEDTKSNAIGAFVTYLVSNPKLNVHVGLATATFMRGDMRHILPDDMADKFVKHHVPYDVYFNTMRPVESFELNVMCSDYLDAVERLFRKRVCPTIIYLAKRNSRYATKCKYTEVRKIISRLEKVLKVKKRIVGPLTMLGGLKVLDLVTDGQAASKEWLNNGGDPDIIIALDMCKEGFDWIRAERSIIIGERHSVPEMIQMIGRLFRRSKGKTNAEVFQVLPCVVRGQDREKFQEGQNKCLTVVFSAMLLEDVFAPIAFSGKRGPSEIHRIADLIPDTDAWQALIRDFIITVGKKTWDESLAYMPSLLKRHKIPKSQHKWVWKVLRSRMAILTRKHRGLSIDVPFDVLKDTDLTEGILSLSSGLCGTATFEQLREVIGREYKIAEQWVPEANRLAEENGGILPGYHLLPSGMGQAITKYPELFRHLKRAGDRFITVEEWVIKANEIAEGNAGILPRVKSLPTRLAYAILRRPDLFAHLEKEEATKSPEQWVPDANRLAEENGDVLPIWVLLPKGLRGALQRRPELFKHIKRDKSFRRQTAIERKWLDVASRLHEDNGGIIPPLTLLPFSLRKMLSKPAFKDFKRLKRGQRAPERHWNLSALAT